MTLPDTSQILPPTGTPPEAVVIGTSAGALDALSTILPKLPADFPLPIMVVVHLPAAQDSLLAGLLQTKCQVRVIEAGDKEPIQRGTVLIAPPDYHLLVEKEHVLSLSDDDPVNFSRPSIDVLFETAVDAYGAALVGVILTGANNDGAKGLRAVNDAGGITLVQRPDLAYTSAMPLAALTACPAARALSLDEIAQNLLEIARYG